MDVRSVQVILHDLMMMMASLTQVLHAGDIICEGFVRPLKTDAKAATPATADKEKESEWSFGETETVPSMHFYNAVSRMGLCYGPQFRMVQRLNTAADTEAQLRCCAYAWTSPAS